MSINKEFDRSVAFTFYKEWKEDADMIEEDYGCEGKTKFYDAIIDYALYEIEPEMKPPVKYFWNTIKEKIDASQEHRSRGFSKVDTETSDKIISYKNEHPESSQREIADAIGCSLGKVNKTLKNEASANNTNTSIITNTITTTSTTMNVNMNTEDNDEIKICIIESFKHKHKWGQIQSEVKEKFNQSISYDFIKETIDEYKEDTGILDKMKYTLNQQKEASKLEEKLKRDKEKASAEAALLIDACSEFFKFEPTVDEIMESYICYNKPMAYGQTNYYAFDIDTMKKFINDNGNYIGAKCWDDVIKSWTKHRNSVLGFE